MDVPPARQRWCPCWCCGCCLLFVFCVGGVCCVSCFGFSFWCVWCWFRSLLGVVSFWVAVAFVGCCLFGCFACFGCVRLWFVFCRFCFSLWVAVVGFWRRCVCCLSLSFAAGCCAAFAAVSGGSSVVAVFGGASSVGCGLFVGSCFWFALACLPSLLRSCFFVVWRFLAGCLSSVLCSCCSSGVSLSSFVLVCLFGVPGFCLLSLLLCLRPARVSCLRGLFFCAKLDGLKKKYGSQGSTNFKLTTEPKKI